MTTLLAWTVVECLAFAVGCAALVVLAWACSDVPVNVDLRGN